MRLISSSIHVQLVTRSWRFDTHEAPSITEEVPDDLAAIPLGKAKIARSPELKSQGNATMLFVFGL